MTPGAKAIRLLQFAWILLLGNLIAEILTLER
jgi:hypothetical protein